MAVFDTQILAWAHVWSGDIRRCPRCLENKPMPRRMLFIVAFTVPDTDTTEPEDVVAMLTDLTKNSLDPMAPENQHITIEVYEVHES